MELLGDVSHVESRFGLFGDSVSVSAIWVHSLHQWYQWLRNLFWTHPMVLLGDKAQVEARFGPFGDNVNLDAKQLLGLCRCTMGLEIILDAPDGTPR
jgi:hypothetical protein